VSPGRTSLQRAAHMPVSIARRATCARKERKSPSVLAGGSPYSQAAWGTIVVCVPVGSSPGGRSAPPRTGATDVIRSIKFSTWSTHAPWLVAPGSVCRPSLSMVYIDVSALAVVSMSLHV
jgi:hypothetical protein